MKKPGARPDPTQTVANDFARQAIAIGKMADEVNPPDGDKYEQTRKLTVFHLRCAAKNLRELAEHLAKLETV